MSASNNSTTQPPSPVVSIASLLRERILVLDGAMGSRVQAKGLEETDFRGERFANHPKDLKGDNELLVLTRPEVIREIHDAYLEAGADLIETNTFGSRRLPRRITEPDPTHAR